jgi:hypothetical protein
MNKSELLSIESNDRHYQEQYVNPSQLMIMRRERKVTTMKKNDNPIVLKIFHQ